MRERLKIQGGIARKFVKGAAVVKETAALPNGVRPAVICTTGGVQYRFAVHAALCKLTPQTEHCLNLAVLSFPEIQLGGGGSC